MFKRILVPIDGSRTTPVPVLLVRSGARRRR